MSRLLSIKNLSIAYQIGNTYYDAVRDVSFDLDEGHSLALVGESGSGKSTIALSLLGLLPRNAKITAGEASFASYSNIYNVSYQELREIRWKQISMIFQGSMNALDPIFTVGKQMVQLLRYHRRISKEGAQQISMEYIRKVGLTPSVLRLYPHELSGGMKQRVVIALSLLLDSKLLVADEPTTALDVTTQAEIVSLLLKLKAERNMSMLFITHDLSLAPQVCDEIAVMYGGTTMERGNIHDVLRTPKNPYTKALISSVLTLDRSKAQSIPGDPPNIQSMPHGCPFNTRCPSVFNRCVQVFPDEYLVDLTKVRCLLYDGNRRNPITSEEASIRS
jgi:peptide/nickel transport system ATP-binding protein